MEKVRLFKMYLKKVKGLFFLIQVKRGGERHSGNNSFHNSIFHLMVTKLFYFMIPGLGTIVESLLFLLSHQ